MHRRQHALTFLGVLVDLVVDAYVVDRQEAAVPVDSCGIRPDVVGLVTSHIG